jgi:CysZ protein
MEFMKGMLIGLTSIRYIFLDGLKRFILIPISFNFVLFLSLAYILYRSMIHYSDYYVAQLPTWLHFLQGFFFIIFALSFFLIFLSTFTVIFNLIAAPFNGLLAEKAQHLIYNTTIPSLSFYEIALRSIKRQIQFLLYFVPRFCAMVLLFFIPFIQPIYPLLWFIFNAWILSIQYQDFAMDNNLVPFQEMKNKVRKSSMISLGFGSVINLASFVPALNLIMMPAAVIGGVILFCEQHNISAKPIPQLTKLP